MRTVAIRIGASRWANWALWGATLTLAVGLTLHVLIDYAKLPIESVGRDAAVSLLAALVGLAPFGAIAVTLSIDLSDRYATDLGPEYAALLLQDDKPRDTLLGLIASVFAASLVGLLLASAGVHGLAAAIVPAGAGLVFVTLLVAYVGNRLELLRPARLRRAIAEVLRERLARQRQLLLEWTPTDYMDNNDSWRSHHAYVRDFRLLSELGTLLLDRGQRDDAEDAFQVAVDELGAHAAARRALKRDLSGPTRITFWELSFSVGPERKPPTWMPFSGTGPAVPVDGWSDTSALWFEDVAAEMLAAELIGAMERGESLYVLMCRSKARVLRLNPDPVLDHYVKCIDLAIANADARVASARADAAAAPPTITVQGSSRVAAALDPMARTNMARDLVSDGMRVWVRSGRPTKLEGIGRAGDFLSGVYQLLSAAVSSGDRQTPQDVRTYYIGDEASARRSEIMGTAAPEYEADLTAFLGATGLADTFERYLDQAAPQARVVAAKATPRPKKQRSGRAPRAATPRAADVSDPKATA
jgi:hypothetical protein